ncbi:MAG TPA: hypothetical protein DHM42_04215, partial [Clostridiales bacterium]|nr:hypothetical protein [Clostridiales bacterium]
DYDGTVLKTESVGEGNDAVPPTPEPTRAGYTFTGWDTDYTNVISDLTVTAEYNPIGYTVRFVDYDDSLIVEKIVEYGLSATPPSDPIRTGYVFEGWDTDYTNVTSDLIVKAEYSVGVVGYEARNVQTWSTGWWIFTTYYTRAEIYIFLGDGTEYNHGYETESSSWDYPTIDRTINGTAIADSTGEEVNYSVNIYVEP